MYEGTYAHLGANILASLREKTIGCEGMRINRFLPKKFQHAYGKPARLLVLLPEQKEQTRKKRRPGSAKGVLRILSEDDEHLDDFKTYLHSQRR